MNHYVHKWNHVEKQVEVEHTSEEDSTFDPLPRDNLLCGISFEETNVMTRLAHDLAKLIIIKDVIELSKFVFMQLLSNDQLLKINVVEFDFN
jgi:hypothetical protein